MKSRKSLGFKSHSPDMESEKPKTLAECKEGIAIKYRYHNWEEAYRMNGGESFRKMMDEVSEKYADQFKTKSPE
jgi:hypothetical protein